MGQSYGFLIEPYLSIVPVSSFKKQRQPIFPLWSTLAPCKISTCEEYTETSDRPMMKLSFQSTKQREIHREKVAVLVDRAIAHVTCSN
jgi:hypothetical protein